MVVVSGLDSPVFFKHPSGHKPYFKCKENNRSHRRQGGCRIYQIITLPILAKQHSSRHRAETAFSYGNSFVVNLVLQLRLKSIQNSSKLGQTQ